MNTKGELALSILKELSFPRVSGSEKERQAAELIQKQIRRFGYEPVCEKFSYRRSVPVTASLRMTAPEEISWEVTGLIDAPETPVEGIEADFYYMKHIDEVSLRLAKDKFILLNDRPGEQDYARLAKAGIRGFLLLSGSIRDTPDNSDLDTRYDEISLISASVLDEEIRFLTFFFDRLTNAAAFPIERTIPDELRKKLAEYFGTGLSQTELREPKS